MDDKVILRTNTLWADGQDHKNCFTVSHGYWIRLKVEIRINLLHFLTNIFPLDVCIGYRSVRIFEGTGNSKARPQKL